MKRARVRAIKKSVKKGEKYFARQETARVRLEQKMNVSNRRINKWKVISNEFNRIANRDRHYAPAGVENVREDHAERPYSFERRAVEGPTSAVPEFAPEVDFEAAPEATPDQYIRRWSALFPAEHIHPTMFKQKMGLIKNNSLPFSTLEGALRDYLIKNRTSRIQYTDAAIKTRIEMMRAS